MRTTWRCALLYPANCSRQNMASAIRHTWVQIMVLLLISRGAADNYVNLLSLAFLFVK
jgi:hypothetical protein